MNRRGHQHQPDHRKPDELRERIAAYREAAGRQRRRAERLRAIAARPDRHPVPDGFPRWPPTQVDLDHIAARDPHRAHLEADRYEAMAAENDRRAALMTRQLNDRPRSPR